MTRLDLDYNFVHHKFKLDGFNLDKNGLCCVAYSMIKEGEPYEQEIGEFILDWFDNNSFIEMHTSGTTGLPKVIQISKQAMVNSALATGSFFDVQQGEKALLCLPAEYVAGKMMLVRAFILGWELDIVEPSTTPLENVSGVYNFSAMVPLQAQNSIGDLHKVKKLILGGAKVNSALAEELQEIPTEVYETYGMTETVTHIAAKKVGEEAFTVLPGVKVEQDERDCLVIEAARVAEEPIVTNDVVKVTDDNHFVWLGRHDNVINSGGVKLFPEQIEERLSGKIDNRFFVKGMPDAKLGEKLVLVVESEPYTIDDKVFKALDKFEKPKEVLFVEKFAETPSGKIIRDKSMVMA